jgi:hypothetical protein
MPFRGWRTGHIALASQHATRNLSVCERQGWNDDVARCHWLRAECALAEGRLESAAEAVKIAEPIFRRGQLVFWLARLHLTAGTLALARHDVIDALHHAGEALSLAQPHDMKLVHADTLVLRGRARLLEAGPGQVDHAKRALDDAAEALSLARKRRYLWAERDALLLQAGCHEILAKARDADPAAGTAAHAAAEKARADAAALAKKLVLTGEDLAKAGRDAEAWLAELERG